MSGRAGSSLIEGIIALAVLAIGLVGAAATMAVARGIAGEARQREEAARIITQEIERFALGACPPRDTSWRRAIVGAPSERWSVVVRDSGATLNGLVQGVGTAIPLHLPVGITRACP